VFHLSPSLAAKVAASHGIVTRKLLRDDGCTENSLRSMVAAGVLVRRHNEVYRLTTARETFESRCVAACMADSSVVVTGAAAARLWGFRHVFRPERPIILIEHDRTPLTRGVILRRTNVLDDIDSTLRDDGIRVATPPRAWFDCARDVDDERFEALTEWVLDHHASVPTLWATRSRLAGRGRPGLARVNRVLSRRAVWQRPSGSGLEVKVLRELERRGVAGLVRQHPIRLQNGVTVHPDGALPDLRWAVEIDHVTWHGGRLDAQRDKGRDRQLRRVGWQVDRVTDLEVREQLDATISELVELIEIRRTARDAGPPPSIA
jgi:very-short-patch-repair endonuclease